MGTFASVNPRMKGHEMTRSNLHAWHPIVILFVLSPAAPAADFYKIDSDHTSVVFSAAHNGLSYTYGMFRDAYGQYQIDAANPANCRFQFVIRADSLDTNNAERDKHLRSSDFFDVQQYPEITFDSTRCELATSPDGGKVYKLVGDLNLHGVKRPIPVLLRMLGEGPGASGKDRRTGFLCQLELKRSDFRMTNLLEKNLVGDAVGITVSFEGILQTQPAGAPGGNQPR
jgi:polyisoprenoid-binding protein YceI